MEIEINGELKEFDKPLNLKSLIDQLVQDTKGLAVALNNSVIPKTNWPETLINETDKVLLIRATQGG